MRLWCEWTKNEGTKKDSDRMGGGVVVRGLKMTGLKRTLIEWVVVRGLKRTMI